MSRWETHELRTDFLAGMEEKTTFRACVFAAILVLMAATMFC
ncbi:MAG: hypothetical protein ACLUI3_07830 [Christensenellales bacterium]